VWSEEKSEGTNSEEKQYIDISVTKTYYSFAKINIPNQLSAINYSIFHWCKHLVINYKLQIIIIVISFP
jgi:hypothetical protein